MPKKEEDPTVLEGLADQGRGPEDRCHLKPQASLGSSFSQRNTITSSYSSTRGFPPVDRRRQPPTCQIRLPHRFTKTVSQLAPQTHSSAAVIAQKRSQVQRRQSETPRQN